MACSLTSFLSSEELCLVVLLHLSFFFFCCIVQATSAAGSTGGSWQVGRVREAVLCSFASTDKGLVVSDTFTAKFTPEWQEQVHLGLPDTCAQGSRILRLDDQGGKAWVFIEKERRQAQPKLGGFSSKPAGLALFYRNFFTCQSLDNKALSRCWRVQLPGEAERHWWVSIAKIYFFNF